MPVPVKAQRVNAVSAVLHGVSSVRATMAVRSGIKMAPRFLASPATGNDAAAGSHAASPIRD